MTGKAGRNGGVGGQSTDKARKVVHNNLTKKSSGSDLPEFPRR